MRTERFHMERDVIEVGETVEIIEGVLPMAYYYTVKPARAMSGNFTAQERIKSKTGVVKDKTESDGTFYVYIEFED